MSKDSFSPKKEEKEVISIRMSIELLKRVDDSALMYDMSRNEFLNQCIQYALEHLETSKHN